MQYLSGLDLAKRDPDWTKKIALCGWCEYQSICPAWNPEAALAPAGEPMAEPAAQTTGRTEATPDSGGAEADGASGGVQLDLL